MLDKLENMGITVIELKWFENYLNERKQCTKFKGSTSNEIDVPIGLPQGTQLSVYLFLLYINDITEMPDLGEIVLFADDTAVIVKHKSAEMAVEIANREMRKIESWLISNKLKLHAGKSKWILIDKKVGSDSDHLVIKMENQIIERVKEIEYLGLII